VPPPLVHVQPESLFPDKLYAIRRVVYQSIVRHALQLCVLYCSAVQQWCQQCGPVLLVRQHAVLPEEVLDIEGSSITLHWQLRWTVCHLPCLQPTNVLARYGRLDYCLNNAGIEGERALLQDYPTDMFDKVGAGAHCPIAAPRSLVRTAPSHTGPMFAAASVCFWSQQPSRPRFPPARGSDMWVVLACRLSAPAVSHAQVIQCISW